MITIKKMPKIELERIASDLALNCGNPLEDNAIMNTLVIPLADKVYQRRWERIIRILEAGGYHIS